MSAEALVLELLAGTNRPYNGVADMLATKGVKKAAAEKALDALAEKGKVVRKEFGKTKIYIPSQEGLAAATPEEAAAAAERLKQLQELCRAEDEAVAALKRGKCRGSGKQLSAATAALSVEQLQAKVAELEAQQAQQATKLAALRGGGARVVKAEDVAKVEKAYSAMLDKWALYRRQFRSVWDAVSEGLDGKEEALFEEMGVDSDKMVGADFEGAKALLQPPKKLRR
ncbi:hypothetical protein COHA_009752 [Chlorella ohadii]|uniref:Homologous-pairing protein 2 winged helix domain-containing protein n=1 Tax=Chlorella ohadii TaxID=2649997 RepID=A0AAD5GXK6_9CHLO|nr:hypothetical protein COHA_009752 [Chlorella ohadii]